MAEQGLTIGVGELRFNVRYSNVRTGDRGPSLRIYGDVEGKPVQLLRFDCFEDQPHFHYDPDGKNNQLRMDKTKVSDPVAWSMDYLRGNVASLVRIAGYGALADQLDEGALTAALPTVEKALRDSVPAGDAGDGGQRLVLHGRLPHYQATIVGRPCKCSAMWMASGCSSCASIASSTSRTSTMIPTAGTTASS